MSKFKPVTNFKKAWNERSCLTGEYRLESVALAYNGKMDDKGTIRIELAYDTMGNYFKVRAIQDNILLESETVYNLKELKHYYKKFGKDLKEY
jgi:hypothetical protein